MSGDNNFSFEDSSENNHEFNSKAEELRQQLEKINKKLTGEDPAPVTHVEILQFLRVVNYNFVSLTSLMQAVLLKNAEIDEILLNLELNITRIDKHLREFFETDNMLDEIMKEDLSVSGSAPDNKFPV